MSERIRALTKLLRSSGMIHVADLTLVKTRSGWIITTRNGLVFNKDRGPVSNPDSFVADNGSGEHWQYVTRFSLQDALTYIGGEWTEIAKYVPNS